MRTILIALVMALATQAGADTKKYGKKECNEISAVIDRMRGRVVVTDLLCPLALVNGWSKFGVINNPRLGAFCLCPMSATS